MTELPIRIIQTEYKQYLEIPTEGWSLARRWDWIKTIVTGGDIVHRPKVFQNIDLRTPKIDDSQEMP